MHQTKKGNQWYFGMKARPAGQDDLEQAVMLVASSGVAYSPGG
jgi:hypothetical protein